MKANKELSQKGKAALWYAQNLNWPILPLHSIRKGQCTCQNGKECPNPGKHPRFEKNTMEHGVKDATTDQTIIKHWWLKWPDANVGMATGEKSADVLDVDLKDDGPDTLHELEKKNGKIPDTIEQITGSGGRQIFFKPSGLLKNEVRFAPGLDIRTDGGLVVLPPSSHISGGVYVWEASSRPEETQLAEVPGWIIDQAGKSTGSSSTARDFDKTKVWEGIPEGQRDEQLFKYACSMRERGFDRAEAEQLIHVAASRCKPPFPADDASKKVALAWAKYAAGGPSVPTNMPQTFTAAQLREMECPEPEWIIPGILPEGLSLLVGRPKMGKSFMVLETCISMTCGGFALGRENLQVLQRSVLYISLEDIERRLKKRIENLNGQWSHLFHMATAWPKLDKGGLVALDGWLDEHQDVKVVVIDTWGRIKGRSNGKSDAYENDVNLIEPLKLMADRRGVSVILVHHSRKMAGEDPLDEVSGSTGLTGSVDAILLLRRDRVGGTTLYVRGRDVEEQEFSIQREKNGGWTLTGKAEEKLTTDQILALDAFKNGSLLSPTELGKIIGKKRQSAQNLISRLIQLGKIRSFSTGVYGLNVTDDVSHVSHVSDVTHVSDVSLPGPQTETRETRGDTFEDVSLKPTSSKALKGERHERHVRHVDRNLPVSDEWDYPEEMVEPHGYTMDPDVEMGQEEGIE